MLKKENCLLMQECEKIPRAPSDPYVSMLNCHLYPQWWKQLKPGSTLDTTIKAHHSDQSTSFEDSKCLVSSTQFN